MIGAITIKRIMLLPSPPSSGSIGSVTKCIGIANILKEKNCEVCFVIGGKLKKFIEEKGFKVYDYPVPHTKGTMININSAIDFIEWTGMAEEEFVENSVKMELEAIKDFKPDVIFAETRLSASISSRIAKVPSVMIASWPCSPDFPANRLHQGRLESVYNKVLKHYGLEEIENITELIYKHADIKLAPTIPELEPELDRNEVKFTGYILDIKEDKTFLPDWYYNWVNLPQIFIYLSVGALLPDLYFKVITDTFKDLPFRVICACGFHYSLEQLPEGLDNIKFMRYIPVASIISDTYGMIFHGGQDTMLTSLLHGIPSLTIPGNHFERGYNSTKLQDLGVSKKLSIYSFRETKLKTEINNILSEPYIGKCKILQKQLENYRGTEECVDTILKTASL